ncbi:MAG: asparaginase [Hirschia sp.]|nr:asparaginase [Hirschia sp.]MBF19145.1 asparaginase [Hirschia sp.]
MTDKAQPILILTTGGTIDKQYFDALSAYQISDTTIGRLLQVGRVTAPVRIVELMRKDSLELTDEDRTIIHDTVQQAPETLIVIAHGTDTMTVTAQALSDIEGKTIALMGALAPARFAESDAAFNLGMAMATVQTAGPGVYITMSGHVFRAGEVAKDREAGAFVHL